VIEETWKIKLPPRLIQLLDIYQGYRTALLIASRWISLVADEWVPKLFGNEPCWKWVGIWCTAKNLQLELGCFMQLQFNSSCSLAWCTSWLMSLKSFFVYPV